MVSTFKETPMDYICDEFTSDLEALDTKVHRGKIHK